MKSLICALTLAMTLGGAQYAGARPDAGYTVVVSAANPVATLTRDQASKLFLKKAPTWSDGREVAPVDQPEGSAVREAFTKAVLHKSVPAVKSYWQQQIFSGRGVPPTERPTDDEVLSYVRGNPAAIGYVSSSAAVGAGVRVVQLTD